MIAIPPELAESHLQETCKKGHVLYFDNFEGTERDKSAYFVILTGCENGTFLAVRGTKRLELYEGAGARRISHDTLLIKAGETTIFPKDTILDFNWIKSLSLRELAKLLGAGVGQKGVLPPAVISKIDSVVEGAITINPRNKARILGG